MKDYIIKEFAKLGIHRVSSLTTTEFYLDNKRLLQMSDKHLYPYTSNINNIKDDKLRSQVITLYHEVKMYIENGGKL